MDKYVLKSALCLIVAWISMHTIARLTLLLAGYLG